MGFHSRARVTKSRSIARVTAPPAAQIFSPTGASLVTECGTPTFGGQNVSPTGAQLVAQGGTPVYGGINARPTGASLVVQGGTPTWSIPLTLSGLVAWYAADQITGKNDGDAVSQWNDLSGNGNDLTQATGSNQPLYKTNILNGRPVMRFDGSNDVLSTASFPSLGDTLSIVTIASYGTSTGGDQGLFTVTGTVIGGGEHILLLCQDSTGGKELWRIVDSGGAKSCSPTGDQRGAGFAIRIQVVTGGTTFYRAGTSVCTSTYVPPRPGVTNKLIVGARTAGAGSPLKGDVAEIFFCTSAFDVTALSLVASYALAKYAL